MDAPGSRDRSPRDEADPLHQTVELLEAVKVDHHATLALPASQHDLDAGAEVLGESTLEVLDLDPTARPPSIDGSGLDGGLGGDEPSDLHLQSPHRPLSIDGARRQAAADHGIRNAQQDLGVTLVEPTRCDHRRREVI